MNLTTGSDEKALDALNKTLTHFVNPDGMVDYQSLRDSPFSIQPFLDFIAEVSPQNHPELFPNANDRKAFWINAYNALVIQAIIENPGISSVKEISWGNGVFSRKKFSVGGEKITLDKIENDILRKKYKDPRIHFALNCGSNSCPPLGRRIFTGEELDDQLDQKARDFINDPANVRIDHDLKTVHLSRIFKWYKKDFQREGLTLLEYNSKFFEEPINLIQISSYKIIFNKYDWKLNRKKD